MKADHHGGYHKVFNGSNYVRWWEEQLIPNLTEPSIIFLDNAAYHLVYSHDTPKPSKMKKQECIDYLHAQNEAFEADMSAVELKETVRKFIYSKVPMEIVRIAETHVCFTPPCHSDVQPIELTWARIKRNVSRQYSNQSTFAQVQDCLMIEFQILEISGHEAVQKMNEKCGEIALKFYEEMDNDDVHYAC